MKFTGSMSSLGKWKKKNNGTLKDFYINASETIEFAAQRKRQGFQNHLDGNI